MCYMFAVVSVYVCLTMDPESEIKNEVKQSVLFHLKTAARHPGATARRRPC